MKQDLDPISASMKKSYMRHEIMCERVSGSIPAGGNVLEGVRKTSPWISEPMKQTQFKIILFASGCQGLFQLAGPDDLEGVRETFS